MTKFQQRLHDLRTENGYSLESLANVLNEKFGASFNKGMLSKYESGKTIPDFKNIPYLAEIFNVSVDYLIGVSDNPTRHIPTLEKSDDKKPEIPHLVKSSETNKQYYFSDETAAMAQELFENKDMRVLFDAARGSSAKDLQMVADMLKRFKETNPDG